MLTAFSKSVRLSRHKFSHLIFISQIEDMLYNIFYTSPSDETFKDSAPHKARLYSLKNC